jgi:MFS family permease
VSAAHRVRLARNVALVCAIRLLFWTHFVSAILVPFFRDWGGIGLDRILLLNAWFMFWGFALEVPTGAIADRFGRKVSATLGYALGALAVVAYVSAPRFEVFLAAEIVMALSYALVSGAEDALLYDSLAALGRSADVQRVAARAESLKLTGIVLGALGGAWLSGVVGLRATLALQALPMGAAALLGLALFEPPHSGDRERAAVSWAQIVRDGLGHLRRTPVLRALALDLVGVNALAFLMIWLYQPLLESAGIGQRWFGVVHVGLCLGQIALLQSAARIESVLGSHRALLTSFALGAGAAFVALGQVRSPWAVVPLVILAVSFGLARAPLMFAELNAHIPSERRATVLSGVSMLRTLAIVLANGAAALGTRASLHGTVLAAGVLLLALASSRSVRRALGRSLRPDPALE